MSTPSKNHRTPKNGVPSFATYEEAMEYIEKLEVNHPKLALIYCKALRSSINKQIEKLEQKS